jgi:uncharacterized BrkB/YihY/UPF0761 family membrane protein
MDLAKSWLTALAVYLAGSMVTAFAAVASKSQPDEFTGTGGAITWNAVPSLVIYLIMAALSALVHSVPQRSHLSRHALAVLPVPALLILGGVVFGLVQGSSPAGVAAGALAAIIGTAAGWWAADRLRRRGQDPTGSGYF